MVKSKKRKRAKPQPISLTVEELRALLSAAKAASFFHWLFFLVAYWQGYRVSEVLAIRRDDVTDGFITCQRLKGGYKTRQKLVRHEDSLLDEAHGIAMFLTHRRRVGRWDRIFDFGTGSIASDRRAADRLIKKYGEIAGIPAHKRHMHVLRHSRGQHWVHQTGIEHTRQALGQVSILSAQVYARVTDEQADEALKRAIQS